MIAAILDYLFCPVDIDSPLSSGLSLPLLQYHWSLDGIITAQFHSLLFTHLFFFLSQGLIYCFCFIKNPFAFLRIFLYFSWVNRLLYLKKDETNFNLDSYCVYSTLYYQTLIFLQLASYWWDWAEVKMYNFLSISDVFYLIPPVFFAKLFSLPRSNNSQSEFLSSVYPQR